MTLDKEYIKARNALISMAEEYADKKAGGKPPRLATRTDPAFEAWASSWNRYYHGKMNELAKGVK